MFIPFGRLMLLFFIASGMFNVASNIEVIKSVENFGEIYIYISSVFGVLAIICLVIWLLITIWKPSTLFMPGGSLSSIGWLKTLICGIPHFRIGLSTLIIGLLFTKIIPLVSAIAITIFLVAIFLWLARILLMFYGSAN